MNERFKELYQKAAEYAQQQEPTDLIAAQVIWHIKFAELIVQDCANFVRETYDHDAAESIAWTMEINYGLHGDYA